MRAALKGLADYLQAELDALDGAAVTVHRDYAYGVAAPYVIVSTGSHPTTDALLGGQAADSTSGTILTTSVGATADQARWVADRVRGILAPDLRPLRFATDDRLIEVSWAPTLGVVEVDRDVTLPNTRTHPALTHEEFLFSAHAFTPATESS